jgi:hypothetical protein
VIVSLPAGYGDLTLFKEDIDKVLEGVKKHPKFTADVVVAISRAVATQEKHDAAWAALGANLRDVFENDKMAFLASEDSIMAIILNALSKPRRDAYTDKVPPKKKNIADAADIGIRREARRKAQLYVNQVFTRLKNYVFPPVQLEGNAADRKAKKGACANCPTRPTTRPSTSSPTLANPCPQRPAARTTKCWAAGHCARFSFWWFSAGSARKWL